MKRISTGASLIIVVILLIIVVFLRPGRIKAPPSASTPDLSSHPIYSSYDFGRDDEGRDTGEHEVRVIGLGTQPLWLPTGVIAEAMKRDTILLEALSEQGLEIRFYPFLKGADVNFFLHRGDLQVAMGGDMPALTACVASDALVTTLIQQGFSSIVARRPMLITELRGKRTGYAFGSNAHYALLQTLSSAGLQETDVRLIPLDVNEMPEALAKGEIDAFSAWEPTPTIAVTRYEGLVVIHRNLTSGYLYFSPLFADQYPQAVRQIVASEVRALNWMRKQDQNLLEASQWTLQIGQDLSKQTPVLTSEQYAALVKRDLLGTSTIAAIPKKDLAAGGKLFREFEFLQGLGNIPDTVEWDEVSDCFDLTLLEEVLSKAQKYQVDTYRYAGSDR